MPFRVALDAYHGPLDLLLHLVRMVEVELATVPLARLTDQYLAYVEVLERLEADEVGEFLDVASTLLEMKSRLVLPDAEATAADSESEVEDHERLVERLLEYKAARDLAAELERRGAQWRRRRTRGVGLAATGRSRRGLATPGRTETSAATDAASIEGVELWDLIEAFTRLARERSARTPPERKIVYDDTPMDLHMERVDSALRAAGGPVPFADLFPAEMVLKSTLLGVFLAVLELIRFGHARASQTERFGPITLEASGEPYRRPAPPAVLPGGAVG